MIERDTEGQTGRLLSMMMWTMRAFILLACSVCVPLPISLNLVRCNYSLRWRDEP
jgi:hypothetical protein